MQLAQLFALFMQLLCCNAGVPDIGMPVAASNARLSACVCYESRACPAQTCFVLVVWLYMNSLCLTYIAYCKSSACLNM